MYTCKFASSNIESLPNLSALCISIIQKQRTLTASWNRKNPLNLASCSRVSLPSPRNSFVTFDLNAVAAPKYRRCIILNGSPGGENIRIWDGEWAHLGVGYLFNAQSWFSVRVFLCSAIISQQLNNIILYWLMSYYFKLNIYC